MGKKGIMLGATTALVVSLIAATAFASNNRIYSLKAAPGITITPDPDPIVTLTTLVYSNFTEFGRDRWVESPNGNLIGIRFGGNYGLNNGEVTLLKEEAWITTAGVATNPAERKYAFSEIIAITVEFTGSLEVITQNGIGTQAISSGVRTALNNASSFELDPTSSVATVKSISVEYNSTASYC